MLPLIQKLDIQDEILKTSEDLAFPNVVSTLLGNYLVELWNNLPKPQDYNTQDYNTQFISLEKCTNFTILEGHIGDRLSLLTY